MAMATMRVPFAPLNETRLQSLTSIKNRQNALALATPSTTKRKATVYEADVDTENIDPSFVLSKKCKTPLSLTVKPATTPTGIIKRALAISKSTPKSRLVSSVSATLSTPAPVTQISPLSAPAGRSPTHKRSGLLRCKTASPYTRIDPPSYAPTPVAAPSPAGLGFSISAALSATVPTTSSARVNNSVSHLSKEKASWQFDIYEDTPDELATNLMEHSTCTLDISSDEEGSLPRHDTRDKENVPPENHVSQTQNLPAERRRADRHKSKSVEDGAIDIDRQVLGEIDIKEFWSKGHDDDFIIVADDDEHNEISALAPSVNKNFDFRAATPSQVSQCHVTALIANDTPEHARLLEPIEKAEDGFELWESGSAKGAE